MVDILFQCFVFIVFALPCTANPLDLTTPDHLNSTKAFNATIPDTSVLNVSNALGIVVGCFRQAPLPEPQLSRTNFVDCYNAQEQSAALDPHKPVHFRRSNDSIFLLPNSFAYRTCVIAFDMVSANDEDFFYFSEAREVAIETARRCTAFRKALGGQGLAGPKMLVEVYVSGRP